MTFTLADLGEDGLEEELKRGFPDHLNYEFVPQGVVWAPQFAFSLAAYVDHADDSAPVYAIDAEIDTERNIVRFNNTKSDTALSGVKGLGLLGAFNLLGITDMLGYDRMELNATQVGSHLWGMASARLNWSSGHGAVMNDSFQKTAWERLHNVRSQISQEEFTEAAVLLEDLMDNPDGWYALSHLREIVIPEGSAKIMFASGVPEALAKYETGMPLGVYLTLHNQCNGYFNPKDDVQMERIETLVARKFCPC